MKPSIGGRLRRRICQMTIHAAPPTVSILNMLSRTPSASFGSFPHIHRLLCMTVLFFSVIAAMYFRLLLSIADLSYRRI